MSVETNANAELAMRVKALEADVQRHELRIDVLIGRMNEITREIADLQSRVRRPH